MSGFVARIMDSEVFLSLAQKAKVEKALQEAEKMVAIYDECSRIILRKILEAIIEYRVAVLVGDAKKEEEFFQKTYYLYSLLPNAGLTEEAEEEAKKKMRTIAEGLMERGKNNVPEKRR